MRSLDLEEGFLAFEIEGSGGAAVGVWGPEDNRGGASRTSLTAVERFRTPY